MSAINIPGLEMGKPEITMAPLVDIVFLLLIFFMVTTVFPENEGLVIEKPVSENTANISKKNIVVKINKNGSIYFKNVKVNLSDIKRLLKEEITVNPGATVMVYADKKCTMQSLIDVIDAAKAGGAKQLGIATNEKPVQT